MSRLLAAELLKIRRSTTLWVTAAVVAVGPFLAGVILFIVQDETRAASLGIPTSALLSLDGDQWATVFSLNAQMFAGAVGVVLFTVVCCSVFVHEYAERTLSGLLTVPISRRAIVGAKILAYAAWIYTLGAFSILLSIGVGLILGLGSPSAAALTTALGEAATSLTLMILVLSPMCWLAVRSRGFLLPVSAAVASTLIAIVFGAVPGILRYIPWTMPAVAVGSATATQAVPAPPPLNAISWVIAVSAFAAGALLTWAEIRYGDAPG